MNQNSILTNQIILNQICASFNEAELRVMAFSMNVDWEEMEGNVKSEKVISLLTYASRNRITAQLGELLRQNRPQVDWPELKQIHLSDWSEEYYHEWVARLESYRLAVSEKHNYSGITWGAALIGYDLVLENLYTPQNIVRYRPVTRFEKTQYISPHLIQQFMPAQETLIQTPYLLFLGDPGSGKSTCLHQLAFQVAKTTSINENGEVDGFLPVFCSLRDYGDYLQRSLPEDENPSLLKFIEKQTTDFTLLDLEYLTESKQLLFLFDALDEVIDISSRNRIVEDIHDFVASYQGNGCPVVVTSRTSPYETGNTSLFHEPFVTYEIIPLTNECQQIFISKWMTALSEAHGNFSFP